MSGSIDYDKLMASACTTCNNIVTYDMLLPWQFGAVIVTTQQ